MSQPLRHNDFLPHELRNDKNSYMNTVIQNKDDIYI